MLNYVFKRECYFFWDEAGFKQGPFKSQEDAERALELYVKYLDGKSTQADKNEFIKLRTEVMLVELD